MSVNTVLRDINISKRLGDKHMDQGLDRLSTSRIP